MAANMALLDKVFATEASEMLTNLKSKGVIAVPFFTVRTPMEQAKLWRQSRSKEEIDRMVDFLRKNQAPYIADCIEAVGSCHGPFVTNAPPGNSWHNWGLAIDCFIKSPTSDKALWASAGDGGEQDLAVHSYGQYGLMAVESYKFTWGGHFKMRDLVHVQMPAEPAPTNQYAWIEIDRQMKERFDGATAPVA